MSNRVIRPAAHAQDAAPAAQSDIDETVDAFVARNRDALNQSIRRSRREVAEGDRDDRTIGQIITDGRKRHGAA